MSNQKTKIEKRLRRQRRVRSKIKGTSEVPRLSIFRSNRHIFLQLIDDASGKTLLAASDLELKSKKPITKKEAAFRSGELIAQKAKEKKIERAVFDRGGYRYHGLVKEAAQGARSGGLKF